MLSVLYSEYELWGCSYYPEIFSKGARDYTNTKLRTLPEGTTIML